MPSPTQPTERRPVSAKPPTPVIDQTVETELRRLAGYVAHNQTKIEQLADDAAYIRKMLRNKVMWGVCMGIWVFVVTFVVITVAIQMIVNEPLLKYYYGW